VSELPGLFRSLYLGEAGAVVGGTMFILLGETVLGTVVLLAAVVGTATTVYLHWRFRRAGLL
jgi:uncharacterized membrane protein YeaQ/YmgE (transglycosylase-associated protein family)